MIIRQGRKGTHAITFAAVLLAYLLPGCGGEAGRTGRLDLDLTGSAPREVVREAWLEVSGLTVARADGTRTQIGFDAPRRVDIANLASGQVKPLLSNAELPVGRYEWLQLHLNTRGKQDSFVTLADGSMRELVVPTNGPDPLRITHPFDVMPEEASHQAIDFRLRAPLTQKGPTTGTMQLSARLRLVDTATAGQITATATRPFIARHCSAPHYAGIGLYVFAGDGVTADDIDSARAEPVTVAMASDEGDDTPKRFRASFLPPGPYTVSLTCNARSDRPGRNDALGFFATTGITVRPGETATHRFEGGVPR